IMNDPGNSTAETITLRIHAAISEIAPEAWDACAGDINPTVSHVFLSALEDSGSCTARSGWAPQHLSFADPAGRVIGVVPMYLKAILTANTCSIGAGRTRSSAPAVAIIQSCYAPCRSRLCPGRV